MPGQEAPSWRAGAGPAAWIRQGGPRDMRDETGGCARWRQELWRLACGRRVRRPSDSFDEAPALPARERLARAVSRALSLGRCLSRAVSRARQGARKGPLRGAGAEAPAARVRGHGVVCGLGSGGLWQRAARVPGHGRARRLRGRGETGRAGSRLVYGPGSGGVWQQGRRPNAASRAIECLATEEPDRHMSFIRSNKGILLSNRRGATGSMKRWRSTRMWRSTAYVDRHILAADARVTGGGHRRAWASAKCVDTGPADTGPSRRI